MFAEKIFATALAVMATHCPLIIFRLTFSNSSADVPLLLNVDACVMYLSAVIKHMQIVRVFNFLMASDHHHESAAC